MSFLTEALNSTHNRANFSCGTAMLNNYFKRQAGQDVRRKLSTCFILADQVSDKIKGYYTLSGNSIPNKLIPASVREKLPKSYVSIPVILLGRLAVDKNYQGQGIGKILLIDSLKRCYKTSASIGAFAVIVDPLDMDAETFYEKYGFIKLPSSGKMFLPMKTIEILFNSPA